MATDPTDPSSASHHSKYRLLVTAGPAYDSSTHKTVPVNSPQTLVFETQHMVISLAVRLKHFTGFPASSPLTSSYFDHPLHKSDQYSISFGFIPKQDIKGSELVFGNDFDRPIRDRLPPGFNQAFRIVKWWVDPGLEGDVYADKPYLYGAALSSWNLVRIGERVDGEEGGSKAESKDESSSWKLPHTESFHEIVVEEGADGSGEESRSSANIPADAAARKKHFLTRSNLEAFTFERGRYYQSDFGNGYLDFNDFSLKLPGFTLNVISYVDSKTHELRYTLKNMETGDVYCCVVFTLLFGEELKEMEKKQGDNTSTSSAEAKGDAEPKQGGDGAAKKGDDVEDAPPDEDDVD